MMLPASLWVGRGEDELRKDGSGTLGDKLSSSGVSTEMEGVGERAEILLSSAPRSSSSTEGMGSSGPETRLGPALPVGPLVGPRCFSFVNFSDISSCGT